MEHLLDGETNTQIFTKQPNHVTKYINQVSIVARIPHAVNNSKAKTQTNQLAKRIARYA